MATKSLSAAALGLGVGMLLGGAVGVYSQHATSYLGDVSREKADISKLDWVLLQAQLQTFEWMFFHDFTNPVIPMAYRYDPRENRVISSHLVRPEWYAATNLEKASEVLKARGATYCTALATSFPLLDFVRSPEEIRAACKVDFYTLALTKTGELDKKDIATYAGGQLTLK